LRHGSVGPTGFGGTNTPSVAGISESSATSIWTAGEMGGGLGLTLTHDGLLPPCEPPGNAHGLRDMGCQLGVPSSN
jgi:hypothetical protein